MLENDNGTEAITSHTYEWCTTREFTNNYFDVENSLLRTISQQWQ